MNREFSPRVCLGWLIAILMSFAVTLANAQSIDDPGGWTASMQGDTRILERKDHWIRVGPMESLGDEHAASWLGSRPVSVPSDVPLIETSEVEADESTSGAWSQTRKFRMAGKTARHALFLCPGAEADSGRVIEMLIVGNKLLDLLAAGTYIDKLCKQSSTLPTSTNGGEGALADGSVEPSTPVAADASAASSQPDSEPAPAPAPASASVETVQTVRREASNSPGQVDRQMLARENARIPPENRPIAASTWLKTSWVGFPAMSVQRAHMLLYFDNGNSLSCADWDPTVLEPTAESAGAAIEDCQVERERPNKPALRGFEPGETIDIAFGTVSAFGNDWAGSSASSIAGGTLAMDRDGRIEIGSFTTNRVSSGGNGVAVSSQTGPLRGYYHLDGHTITIGTLEGDVLHGFIGWQSDSGSRRIDRLFLNGEHYWER